VLGAQRGPYLSQGAWEFGTSFRTLRSDDHFKGTEEQHDRHEGRKTYKINRQNMLDTTATYGLDRQTSLTLSVPLVAASRSNRNAGIGRSLESGSGVGDISLVARRWMMNTESHRKGNFALGLGVKAPTGDYEVEDDFPDPNVPNSSIRKPVDQSIQVGDGGWGIILDLQGFQRVGSATLFGSALYLANPRNTNGTVSSTSANALPHSVADQFLLRLGAAVPIKKVEGLAFTLAGRAEGVPHGDLFGGNDGARRPGVSIFVEPGLVYSAGRSTLSFSVPIAVKRRTFRSVGSAPDYQDATLADTIVLASFSRRFGGPDDKAERRLPREDRCAALAAAVTGVSCPACSHGMPGSAKFCSECGAKLVPAAATPVTEEVKPAVAPATEEVKPAAAGAPSDQE
jgi:hypothetical protein